ncbi:hypothetical protein Y1Q_0006120 [Alligator mississippiensis]|uniref:Uncharacterized protein n=1 Tax=Alligator mississippiensis TaxID=8496 RepID=A0A151N444_ALLMI|nr:hypothetical protein Y1Q_0006120 [Alligator mississippiensis]
MSSVGGFYCITCEEIRAAVTLQVEDLSVHLCFVQPSEKSACLLQRSDGTRWPQLLGVRARVCRDTQEDTVEGMTLAHRSKGSSHPEGFPKLPEKKQARGKAPLRFTTQMSLHCKMY